MQKLTILNFRFLLLLSTVLIFGGCFKQIQKCQSTDAMLAVCAIGLEEKTIREFKIRFEDLDFWSSTETAKIGYIAKLLEDDSFGKHLPVMPVLNGYWDCISQFEAKEGVLSVNGELISESVIRKYQVKLENVIKAAMTSAGASETAASNVTAATLSESSKATQELEKISSSGKQTIVHIFLKDQLDKNFSYPRLREIIEQKKLTYSSNVDNLSVTTPSPINRWHEINAIWYSESTTDIRDVQIVALIMISAGAKIVSIQPYCKKSKRYNKNIIQVGAFPDTIRKDPYTVASIIEGSKKIFARVDKCG